ncbi:MAG: hypothetical protein H6728_00405 [Myxococcales bacterium]|nr:hypothetical protein [Myxococcales bacterium]MCB9641524.1 hypothetical protein [Myxococcales bacterium]
MTETKKRGRWLRWLLGLAALGLVASLVLALFFPKELAQIALNRLKKHGLSGEVVEANIFSGVLRVRSLQLVRVQRGTSLSLHASEGIVNLWIWRVLLGGRRVAGISVHRPKIRVLRGMDVQDAEQLDKIRDAKALWRRWGALKGLPTSQPAPQTAQKKATAKEHAPQKGLKARIAKLRLNMKRFRQRLLQIDSLKIEDGKLFFAQHRPQKILVRVESVHASLLAMRGALRIQKADISVKMKKQTLQIQVPQGELALSLDELLSPSPKLERLRLVGPHVRLMREGPPNPPRDPKKLRETLQLLSPRVLHVELEQGRFSMQHRLGVGRERHLQIKSLRADLRELKGGVTIKDFVLQSQEPHQKMELRIPQATVSIDLWPLLYGMISLDQVKAQKPLFVLHFLKKRAKKRRLRRKPPWLKMKNLELHEGEVTLHFKMRNRKAPQEPPRKVKLVFNRVFAKLQDLDIRYLLARPFSGEGKAWALGHGNMRFVASKQANGGHRLSLRHIPSTLINRFIDREKMPLQIKKGQIHALLDLRPKDDERTWVQATFRVHQLEIGVVKENKKLLKKAMIGILSGIVNKHFRKIPEGYSLTTGFSIKTYLLEDMNPKLMQTLSRRFMRGFLDAIIEKHPILRPFRKTIEKRVSGAQDQKPKGWFAKWRDKRKKRREERKKQRKKRGFRW